MCGHVCLLTAGGEGKLTEKKSRGPAIGDENLLFALMSVSRLVKSPEAARNSRMVILHAANSLDVLCYLRRQAFSTLPCQAWKFRWGPVSLEPKRVQGLFNR